MNSDLVPHILPYGGLFYVPISSHFGGKKYIPFWSGLHFADCLDNKHTIAPACEQISYSAVSAMQENDPFNTENSAPGTWVNSGFEKAKG